MSVQGKAVSPRMIWRVNPLPDFLADPSLTGESQSQRLEEHIASWVQTLAGLSSWQDRASFALHYLSDGRQVKIFFVALAHDPGLAPRLRSELTVLLRASKLMADPSTSRVSNSAFAAEV